MWNVSDALELLTQKQQVHFSADNDEEVSVSTDYTVVNTIWY